MRDPSRVSEIMTSDRAGEAGGWRRRSPPGPLAGARGGDKPCLRGPVPRRAVEGSLKAETACSTTRVCLRHASIEDVRRQREDWQRDATKALATGRTAEAIDAYGKRGHVQGHETQLQAVGQLIDTWADDIRRSRTGNPDLILAPTRKDVAMLNSSARDAMRQAGRLGNDRMVDASEETVGRPPREFKLDLALGDRLLFTKNDKQMGVRNGTLGTLEAFGAGCLVIRLDNRERVVVDLARYRNITHGYAMTVHKAQGVTVDRVHVLAGRSMDRHMAYVALSRHRERVTMHYGRDQFPTEGNLILRLSRRRLKTTTLDYMKPDYTMLKRTGPDPFSPEKRSDRIRSQAIDWRKRNPDRDFGLEM